MKIAVLVKEVPDTYGDRYLNLETGLVDRGRSEAVIDEICGRALEVAVSYAERESDVEVVAVTVGPESAAETLRQAMAIGAGSAVHVLDPELRGADMLLTAEALAAAITRLEADLVLAGNQSTDGLGGMVPAMLGELLGWPHATNLATIEIGPSSVSGRRTTDHGSAEIEAPLPAIASVTDRHPEARFPTFKSVSAAKKKPITTWSLTDLGVTADEDSVPRSIMLSVAESPPRQGGTKIVDDGTGGEKIAEFLADRGLV